MKVILLKCFLIAVSASLVRCDEETQRDRAAGDQVTARSGHEASLTKRDKPGDSDDLKRLPTTTTSPPEEGGLKALLKSASKEVEVDLLKIPTNDSEAPASSVESEDQLTERRDFVSGPTVNPDRFGLALRHIHRRPPIRHPPIPLPPPLPPHPSATRHPIPKHHPPPHPPRPDHDHDHDHAFPPPDFDFDPPDFFENSGIPHPDDEPFAFGAPFEGHDHEHDPFFSPHLDDDFPPHDDHFSPHDDHFPPHDFDVSSPHDDHFSEPPPPLKPFSEDPIVVFPKRPPPHKHPRPSKHPSKHPPPPLPPPPPSPPHSHHHHHHHPPLHFPSLHLNFITEDSIYRDDVPFKETHNERDRIHPGLTPAGVQGLDPGFISYIKEQTKPYIDSESRFRFER